MRPSTQVPYYKISIVCANDAAIITGEEERPDRVEEVSACSSSIARKLYLGEDGEIEGYIQQRFKPYVVCTMRDFDAKRLFKMASTLTLKTSKSGRTNSDDPDEMRAILQLENLRAVHRSVNRRKGKTVPDDILDVETEITRLSAIATARLGDEGSAS